MSTVQEWPVWKHVGALQRRRRTILWTTLTVSAAIGAFVWGLPAVYRSSASLLVQGQLALENASTPAAIDGRLQTIKQEAFSRARMTELLHRFDLYGVSSGRVSIEDGIERLQKEVQVLPSGTSQAPGGGEQTIAFRVSYVSANPQTAADVANAVASFFIAQNNQLRVEQASRATEYLGAQLAETRRRMQEQEGALQSYTSKIGGLPQQFETSIAAINRLDNQLRLNNSERMRLLERRQTLNNEIAQLGAQLPAETDTSPTAQITRLERDVAEMRLRFGATYPDLVAAERRLEQLKRDVAAGQVARAGTSGVPSGSRRTALEQSLAEVESQIKRITTEDAAITAQIQSYQTRLERLPADQPRFDAIRNDLMSTRAQVDDLQKRYDEARMAERGATTPEFRILDAAVPSPFSAGPQRPLLFAVGVLFALMLGVALAIGVDHTDTSFHSVDDLRQFTRVPVLASIPVLSEPVSAGGRVRRLAVAGAALAAIVVVAGGAFRVAQSSEQLARLLSRVL